MLADPRRAGGREVDRERLERAAGGGTIVVCDKDYAGRAFVAGTADLGVLVVRPRRDDEDDRVAACVSPSHRLGRPRRAPVDYCA